MTATTTTRAELARLLGAARRRTLALFATLGDDDVHEQHFDFMSPVVWDLGHVGNFEELWLLRRLDGRPAHDPALDELYNAFENPRWTRGALPLLARDDALAYLGDVRDDVLALLARLPVDDPDLPLTLDGHVHRMLAQHEAQHAETVLQVLDLRTDTAPLSFSPTTRGARGHRRVDDTERVLVPGGPVSIGTDSLRGTHDNERPRHVVDVPAFAIDRFPVTNRRWAQFVAAGGYGGAHFGERGRAWLAATGHTAPQGWHLDARGEWRVHRFGRSVPLDPAEPVQHVSHFEAEAFAAWAGARLPSELEWEKAAAWDPATGRSRHHPWGDAPVTPARANVGLGRGGPAPVGSFPAGASALGVEQMAGDVYEWTSSPFEGYPGFRAFPYREYSQVFFGGQDHRVLRGSSWAVPAGFARCTYRNWDHPYRRQLFAGLRLAHDVRGPA